MEQSQLGSSKANFTLFFNNAPNRGYLANIQAEQRPLTFKTCPLQPMDSEQSTPSNTLSVKKRKKIVKRFPYNLVQSIQKHLASDMLFNLYGIAVIDEKGLLKEVDGSSLLKSQFNFYAVSGVEIRPNYIIIRAHENRKNEFPMSYYIQRLKHYGDSYLYNMAIKIDFLKQLFEHFFGSQAQASNPEYPFEPLIESIKKLPFMLRVYPSTLVVSNKLIELLGYTVESLTGQCLNLRSFIADLFWTDDYREEVDMMFDLIDNRMKFRKGLINEQEYIQNGRRTTIMKLCTKQEKIIKVKVDRYNLAPNVRCEVVQKVLAQEKLLPLKNDKKLEIKEMQDEYIRDNQDRTIRGIESIMTVPMNLRRENQHLVCGYKALKGRRWAR